MKQITRYMYYSQQRLLTFVSYKLLSKSILTIGSMDEKQPEQLESIDGELKYPKASSSTSVEDQVKRLGQSNSESTEGLEQVGVSLLGRRQGLRRRYLCFSQA